MLKSGKFAVTAKLGIRQGIVLVVLSLMIGGSFNALRPSKFPWVGSWSPSSVTADLLEELQEISLEEACSLRQKNETIFLDARDPGSFDEGHFPGALNIPFGEVEGWVESVRDMAKRMMKQKILSWCKLPVLSLCFRYFLGGIFLYAGIVKVIDPAGFALSIYNYKLLPEGMINAVAILLPWVEIMVGGSLLLGVWTMGSSLVVSVLLGIFACALSINLARGPDISCGCFTTATDSGSINWIYLIRDLGLLGMALHVFFFDQALVSVSRFIRGKDKEIIKKTVHYLDD